MERVQKERLLELYGIDKEEDIYVLTELVGDELEILDPYGGTLTSYGLCYETLRKSIKKLVKLLNEGE
jgi:protein-tyrosine phosphatase